MVSGHRSMVLPGSDMPSALGLVVIDFDVVVFVVLTGVAFTVVIFVVVAMVLVSFLHDIVCMLRKYKFILLTKVSL